MIAIYRPSDSASLLKESLQENNGISFLQASSLHPISVFHFVKGSKKVINEEAVKRVAISSLFHNIQL